MTYDSDHKINDIANKHETHGPIPPERAYVITLNV